MKKRITGIGLIFLVGMIFFISCNKKMVCSTLSLTSLNSESAQKKPYLLLISLDGFRWDYVEKYRPPNLSAFVDKGVKAESLVPTFPSKTFPNHYSIATGMYPDKHGILGNVFKSYENGVNFSYKNKTTATDGRFYKGSPIWLEANKARMVTASYFFVGTEAGIQGDYPTYYHTFDPSIKNEDGVDQAINWLEMPEEKKPHLILMYFGDMDKTGHDYGPGNEGKIKEALFELDKSLGDLFKRVEATGLPVNTIIVSDHGMSDLSTSKIIPTETIINDSLYSYLDNGTIVNIHPNEGVDIEEVIAYLKPKKAHFKLYRTDKTPGFEYKPKNENWGSIQLVADYGYYFLPKARKESFIKREIKHIGVHGYDASNKEMHGIFYANGPAFKKNGYSIPSLENIHIYPLMCEILGLPIPKHIDGKLNKIKDVLLSD